MQTWGPAWCPLCWDTSPLPCPCTRDEHFKCKDLVLPGCVAQSQRELLGGSQQERRQRQESTGRPKGTVGKPVIGLPLLGFCQAGRFVFPRLEPRLKERRNY